MASSLPDPDSTPGNGKAGEDDQASVALNSKGVADLSLSNKLVSSGSRVGTQAVYRLTVHNAGPDTASGVIVRDQLPDGLSLVAAEGGTYDPHTGVWSVGELAVGASVSSDADHANRRGRFHHQRCRSRGQRSARPESQRPATPNPGRTTSP